MNPTLKDIAQAAGVSISTASRALANNPTIALGTREKVAKIAKEMHYRPNANARALQSQRTNSIGLIVPTLRNPFFAAMAAAVEEEAAAAGLVALVMSTGDSKESFANALNTLLDRQIDGILAVPIAGSEAAVADAAGVVPLLLVDRSIGDCPAVVTDPEPGMRAAIESLAAHGHKKVGYLSGPKHTSTGAARFGAGRAAAAEAGVEWVIHHGGFQHEDGLAGTLELLEQGCTALLAADGMMTTGALEACHRAGVGLGRDVALIGFDDVPFLRFQPAPISVVDQDVDNLARVAARQLIAALDKKGTLDGAVLPTKFIPRESSEFTFGGA